MGADFCVQFFCVKKGDDDFAKKKKAMFKVIDKLDIKDYDDIVTSIEERGREEEIEEELENDEEADSKEKIINALDGNKSRYVSIAKGMFKKDIDEAFSCIGCRDVTEIYHKGEIMFITGGMSWGDAPSESYDSFLKLANLPTKVLRAGGIK